MGMAGTEGGSNVNSVHWRTEKFRASHLRIIHNLSELYTLVFLPRRLA